jgi:sulfide:quinone oxidoreductase
MAKVIVLGAGISGHTASAFLRKWLNHRHEVIVISPQPTYNWIPSNIWVGVGKMQPRQVEFELAPIYQRNQIRFIQAKAMALFPEGGPAASQGYVTYQATDGSNREGFETYDFLINATGPKLNFEKTKGLGPEGGHTLSVCTAQHAKEASDHLDVCVERMKKGQLQHFVIGTGHGTCTCQGAAFEYIVNLEFELRRRGVRDRAKITWLSNEYELGDFGMGGMHIKRGGYVTHSKVFTESLFAERQLKWIRRAHVQEVAPGQLSYENLDGETRELNFDFSMLIPPFSGVGLKAFNPSGEEITSSIFAANGFLKVDAEYNSKPFEEWSAADWPKTYQSPSYPNLFAIGIAFAPPHAISRPQISAKGTPISPTPPRTGMPSAMIAKAVAKSVVDMIHGASAPTREASMAKMGAACVASAGASWFNGTAAAMTVFPIIPDYETYPEYGRDLNRTFGEIGLAAHWIKHILHHMFLYKAKGKPFWWMIPE